MKPTKLKSLSYKLLKIIGKLEFSKTSKIENGNLVMTIKFVPHQWFVKFKNFLNWF